MAPTSPDTFAASASEFRGVELDIHGLLTDVYGDTAVGINDGGELGLMNIRRSRRSPFQLTDDGYYKWGPVLSATHVAWIAKGEDIQLPSDDGGVSSRKTPQMKGTMLAIFLHNRCRHPGLRQACA